MSSSPTTFRVPPQDIEAERALLGSMMLRPSAVHEIIDVVNNGSFYVEKHRIIFEAMNDLYRRNEPMDIISVSARLKEKKALESVGNTTYLSELTSAVPSSTNVTHYADIVAKKWVLRNLIDAGDFITNLGFSEEPHLEETLDHAEKKIFEVSSATRQGDRFQLIRDIIPKSWETIERLHATRGELRGVPTGFGDIDTKLAGLQKSDLVILAARPSMGKTTLAMDIARHAAMKHNIPVAIFSLEMSAQQLVDKILAVEAQVDSWKLRTGHALTEDDFSKISDAMARVSEAPIFIHDKSTNTVLSMRSIARRLKSEHGLGLIVVDYLQLIMSTKSYDSKVNEIGDISRGLKALAKELDVPVLALSQLSRAVESRGGRPRLSDLRDSGAIEQDADVVLFIHREDKYNKESDRQNIAEILIEKHRNGPTGMAELYFDGNKTTFMNMDASTPRPDSFEAF